MRVFGLLADHLPLHVARFDRERRHLFVNRAITDSVGRDAEWFIGKTNEELGMPPVLVAQWNAAIDRALAGEPTELTFEWTGPAGPRVFEGKLVPEPAEDGRIETVLGIIRDVTTEVTQRREVAAASALRVRLLENERAKLAGLFAESPAAVSVVRGPDFILELLNPRAKALWGRGDEILGLRLLVGLPELVGQGFEELLRRVVRTGEPWRGEEVPVRIARPGESAPQTHYFDFVYAPLVTPMA